MFYFISGYLLHLDFIVVDLKDGSTLVFGLLGSSALKSDIIMLHFFILSEIISLTNRIVFISQSIIVELGLCILVLCVVLSFVQLYIPRD